MQPLCTLSSTLRLVVCGCAFRLRGAQWRGCALLNASGSESVSVSPRLRCPKPTSFASSRLPLAHTDARRCTAVQNTLRTALLTEPSSADAAATHTAHMGGGSSSARADAVRATLVDAAQMDRIERLLLDADESATDDLRSGRKHPPHRTATIHRRTRDLAALIGASAGLGPCLAAL